MAKQFKVPKNPAEIQAWIDTVPMYKQEQPLDLSFKSREEIRAAQNANLVKQMERLEKFSPYYREKFKEWGLDPKSIQTVDDLEKIPVTSKEEYMKDRGESFKLEMDFNNMLEYILYEITYTTGTTTGMPTRFYNSTYDMFMQSWMF